MHLRRVCWSAEASVTDNSTMTWISGNGPCRRSNLLEGWRGICPNDMVHAMVIWPMLDLDMQLSTQDRTPKEYAEKCLRIEPALLHHRLLSVRNRCHKPALTCCFTIAFMLGLHGSATPSPKSTWLSASAVDHMPK